MVTRFVSAPEYPANANPCQNEAVLVGVQLKTRHRDGKKNPNPHFLSLGLRLLGVQILSLLGNWVGGKPSPIGKSIGKVLSSILLPTGIVSS